MKFFKFLILFSLIALFLNCSWENYIPTSSSQNPETAQLNHPSPNNVKSFKLPSQAVQITKNVYLIGRKGNLDGYAIIHRKKQFDKGGTKPVKPTKPTKDEAVSCYEFLARNTKWKSTEDFYINPTNISNLDHQSVFDIFVYAVDKWESAAEKSNIIGDGYLTYDNLNADLTEPDDINEVYFAGIAEPGVIAVTIVWGIFGGPPQTRELVAWDQVYDEVDFSWSLLGEEYKMDLDNIVTHEMGHTFGLGDLYDLPCDNQTMYGYADVGETNKRTLEAGDIEGVYSLYK